MEVWNCKWVSSLPNISAPREVVKRVGTSDGWYFCQKGTKAVQRILFSHQKSRLLSKMRREKTDLGSDMFKVRRDLSNPPVQGPKVVQTRAG